MPVDKARFQALFGQYFRFDINSRKPFFYKEVQNFLRPVCEACVADFDQRLVKHLSLLPFDPYLVHSCSMDRLTDILVGTISVLSFGDLCSSDSSGVIVQQYREVAAYFKRRWELSAAALPLIDDALSLWLSYPSWDRCREFRNVLQILFVGMLHDNCQADFMDVRSTALDEGVMLSSLNFVRNWMATGFSGHSRRSMVGFVRHCSSTDMQVSRLSDDIRAILWDQLVKRGVDDVYGRFVTVSESTRGLPFRLAVDEYRSSVCDQLRSMESAPASIRRSPTKPERSVVQTPRVQTDGVLSTTTPNTSASKRKNVCGGSLGKASNRGQRTGRKPEKKGRARLANFSSEEVSKSSKHAFVIKESSNEGGSSHSQEY